MEEISEEEFLRNLPAFSDGELEPRQRLAILYYIAAHPDAIHLLIAQERFREQVRAALSRLTPPVPDSLNRSLVEMAGTSSNAPKS